jgi:hypothetical protein
MPRSSTILTAIRRCSPGSKGSDTVPPICLDQLIVDLGLQVLRQPHPAFLRARHREKDLARVEAAPAVVGIEQPDGDFVLAAGMVGISRGLLDAGWVPLFNEAIFSALFHRTLGTSTRFLLLSSLQNPA